MSDPKYGVVGTISTYIGIRLYDTDCPSAGKVYPLMPGKYVLRAKQVADNHGTWWMVEVRGLELGLPPIAWRSIHVTQNGRLEGPALVAALQPPTSSVAMVTALTQA